MSDNDDWDDDESNSGQNDSQLVKDLRRQLKAKDKELQGFREELAPLKATVRQRSVEDVLKAKGVDVKVAKLVPPTAETPEAVEQWLTEYADVLNINQQKTESGEEQKQPLPEEEVGQLRSISASVESGISPAAQQNLMTKLTDPSLTHDQLLQLMASGG